MLESYLNGFDYRVSGLTFTSLFMWRGINLFNWEVLGDYLCISAVNRLEEDDAGRPFMFPPLTRTGSYDPAKLAWTVNEARRRFEEKGRRFVMMLTPFHMTDALAEALPGKLRFEADRPNFDYVYYAKELAELKGRDYHAKKNHLNYFKSHYDYEYMPMTSGMEGDAMEFIREFNERKNPGDPHERQLLMMEERAMRDVFHNLEEVGYISGAILIGGKIEALSIGGRLGKRTVSVHIEKANTEYRGLYQAINNEFCLNAAKDVKYINREEDMGIPGLRKAKLSYKPCMLVEKYTVTFREQDCLRRFM